MIGFRGDLVFDWTAMETLWNTVAGSDMGLQDWCILLGYRGSIAHGMYVPNTDPSAATIKDVQP